MIHRPSSNNHSPQCDQHMLVLLLQDQLDERQSCKLANHLDHCEACRSQLYQLSFSETNWNDTRTVILEETRRKTDWASTTSVVTAAPAAEKVSSLVRWLEPIGDGPAAKDQYIGQVDDYLVKRVIGYGGMGVVLEAWDTKLHRAVAIKAMHPHLAANGTARQRFVREARGAASVVHPNVVAIHTVHAEHDPPYFLMPLIAGESLQARIDRSGPMDVDATLRVAIQIADGLAAAHAQGLVHRDIKPANILVEHGTERALLTDFGVVRALDEATMTASGVIAGTPEYMSPEQASGSTIDTRSDLFSLGCVLYTMLTGRSPFRAENAWGVLRRIESDTPRRLSETRPEISEAVESLVSWLLEKRPEDRIESATMLAEDLRQLLAHYVDRHQHELPQRLAERLHLHKKSWQAIPQWLIACSLVVLACLAMWGLPKTLRFDKSVVSPNDNRPAQMQEAEGQIAHGQEASTLSMSQLLDLEIQQLDQMTTELESLIIPEPKSPN